jgi:iron complex transport system permease protein
LLGLAVLAALCLLFALGTGAIPIPPGAVLRELAAPLGLAAASDGPEGQIVWTLRVPRTLLAALAGAVLGLAGAVMQGLFRNPLADPGLLGVSAGAALGAVLMIVLGLAAIPAPLRPYGTAAAAFAGALLVTLFVLRASLHEGRVLVATMLLAGIVFNSLAGAATSALIFAADDLQLRDILFWTMGSCAGANMGVVGATALAALPLLLAAPFLVRGLNALILGEREAATLGIPLEAMKWGAVLLVALAVGAAVAAAGTIGFVGIVAPHLARLLRGADHRWVLPASALIGAALLPLADALARVAVAPAELPIGLVTALVGGPFFLALLLRQRVSVDGGAGR